MNIVIKCDCGNKVELKAPSKKYTQLRDYLEKDEFRYDGAEFEGDKLKEFRIQCCKCKNWITLGVD